MPEMDDSGTLSWRVWLSKKRATRSNKRFSTWVSFSSSSLGCASSSSDSASDRPFKPRLDSTDSDLTNEMPSKTSMLSVLRNARSTYCKARIFKHVAMFFSEQSCITLYTFSRPDASSATGAAGVSSAVGCPYTACAATKNRHATANLLIILYVECLSKKY